MSESLSSVFLEGSVLLQQGDYDQARKSYEETLSRDPENVEALYGLGIIYQYFESYSKALHYFESALRITEHPEILNNFGVVSAQLGRNDAAMDSFRKAIKLNPVFVDARRNLAQVYIEAGEYDKGVQAYKDLLVDNPEDVTTLLAFARLYAEIGDLESTQFLYERVLAIDPENEAARQGLEQPAVVPA